LGVTAFKIPSGEITNLPFLTHLAGKRKPLILSTGMSTLGEIEEALATFHSAGNSDVSLLHCVTEYPAPFDEINLKALISIRTAFGLPVGYSDHTRGIEIAIAAVALGAVIIEKHFTLDSTLPGPDHRASLEPLEFKRMVTAIRNVERAMGDGIKRPAACELRNIPIVRRSLVAARDIRAGETITSSDIAVKRPGTGISPRDLNAVVGMRATSPIPRDTVLTWGHFK
jgi:N-acetylneuraminate synthase/N,N'-diacetyllegionaminate synthase